MRVARALRLAASGGDTIRFSTSPAARSSPRASLGAGVETPTHSGRLWAVVAAGAALTAAMALSCATGDVDLAAPPVPDFLRNLGPRPEPPATPEPRPS